MNLEQHLIRQMAFSHATFGPGKRTKGVLNHIAKEIEEVWESGGSTEEWTDIVILALDGLTRSIIYDKEDDTAKRNDPGISANIATNFITMKQTINEGRNWPDWRTSVKDKAIEHVK